jgi:hypothetical protein
MYEDDGASAVPNERNTGRAFESAIDHDALLQAEQAERIRQEEAVTPPLHVVRTRLTPPTDE